MFGKYCLKFFFKEKNELKMLKEIEIKNNFEFIEDDFLNEEMYKKKIYGNIDKIKNNLNIKLSEMIMIEYYFKDILGNYFIIIEYKNTFYYVINLNDKIIFLFKEINDEIQEIGDLEEFKKINEKKIGYCFSIINFNEIKYITPFE